MEDVVETGNGAALEVHEMRDFLGESNPLENRNKDIESPYQDQLEVVDFEGNFDAMVQAEFLVNNDFKRNYGQYKKFADDALV